MNDDEAVPGLRPHANSSPGRRLQSLGFFLAGVGAVFLLFVAAYPLGLVSAYPAPPAAAIKGPLGFERKIEHLAALSRRADEPMQAYLGRLTRTVAGGMVHHWTEGDIWTASDARYTRISIFDNYLLWMQSFLPQYGENLQNYEFVTPQKAIDRGYGFCSQVSKIVYSILADQAIEATIYSVPHHTVVESNGNILDSDYGVFVPYSLASIEQNPSIIDSYYAGFEPMLPVLRDAYGQSWQPLGTAEGFREVRAYEAKFENLKWFPPLMLLAMGVLFAAGGALLNRRERVTRFTKRAIATARRYVLFSILFARDNQSNSGR
ncbi:hypothetical protein NKI77_04330 [Mesorhizobium opportunistum]|uniref:Transglutaminase domain-containing protein n=1 Tax=Mesorhizobium opportunistum TaxID=593909 RepID=A0ABV1YDS0_9HYPH|nr:MULTISPECIES: hypothetical protein [Mesorhizobium]ESY68955.1 hypothetical protein X742_09790 [Mesorhizobium sp. LNHC232B00]WJI40646.1 hypothetical protein NL534_10530 [Mesorhizobium opportunistum]